MSYLAFAIIAVLFCAWWFLFRKFKEDTVRVRRRKLAQEKYDEVQKEVVVAIAGQSPPTEYLENLLLRSKDADAEYGMNFPGSRFASLEKILQASMEMRVKERLTEDYWMMFRQITALAGSKIPEDRITLNNLRSPCKFIDGEMEKAFKDLPASLRLTPLVKILEKYIGREKQNTPTS